MKQIIDFVYLSTIKHAFLIIFFLQLIMKQYLPNFNYLIYCNQTLMFKQFNLHVLYSFDDLFIYFTSFTNFTY
jgi:hypothetical protein